MNFSAFSIRNPIPAILLFALLTLAGLLAFRGSGVQDFPDIELPVVTVSASLPGAAPGTLETEVARKLENSIATLAQIKTQGLMDSLDILRALGWDAIVVMLSGGMVLALPCGVITYVLVFRFFTRMRARRREKHLLNNPKPPATDRLDA